MILILNEHGSRHGKFADHPLLGVCQAFRRYEYSSASKEEGTDGAGAQTRRWYEYEYVLDRFYLDKTI